MTNFLLFLYGLSVVVFFMANWGCNREILDLYKRYDVKPPERKFLSNTLRWIFLLLVCFIPGMRLFLLLFFVAQYRIQKIEFEMQGGKRR